jgi:two-component system, response regulator
VISKLRPILLAEDNPLDAELSVDALREARLANPIVVVRDGAEALDWLFIRGEHAGRPPGDPVVVLLDNKMPRMGGLDVLRVLREDAHLRRVPVVMLTSSREESDLARSWDLGVNAYVVKPVDVRQFFEAVQSLGHFWAVLNEPYDSE